MVSLNHIFQVVAIKTYLMYLRFAFILFSNRVHLTDKKEFGNSSCWKSYHDLLLLVVLVILHTYIEDEMIKMRVYN